MVCTFVYVPPLIQTGLIHLLCLDLYFPIIASLLRYLNLICDSPSYSLLNVQVDGVEGPVVRTV